MIFRVEEVEDEKEGEEREGGALGGFDTEFAGYGGVIVHVFETLGEREG